MPYRLGKIGVYKTKIVYKIDNSGNIDKKGLRIDWNSTVKLWGDLYHFGHHVTSIEGGIVSTNNKDLYELMRLKRSHGMAREASPDYFEKYKKEYPELPPSFLFVTDGYNLRFAWDKSSSNAVNQFMYRFKPVRNLARYLSSHTKDGTYKNDYALNTYRVKTV